MKAQRATIMLATAVIMAAGSGMPAHAQVSDGVVLNILRECAKIDDPSARLACYDNNVRAGGSSGDRPVVPGQSGSVVGGDAPIASGRSSQGFGAEDIRSPSRFQPPAGSVEEIRVRVTKSRERQPGIYLLTLEGGAQWIFTDGVPMSFRPPKEGSTVEISRAAMGSFLMVVDGQAAVRVRRVK